VTRLTGYLTRLFFSEAAALAAIVITLLYLVQCLRVLNIITVKGQDMFTLLGQASLVVPLIGAVFLYICVGIGLARALGALQGSGELHIIHSSRRAGGLFRAIGLYATISALIVLALSHFASPMALRRFDEWEAGIAADLVARALVPHRFVEVVPGVTVVIGNRRGEGEISDFFADDRRDPNARRTYSAASAIVGRDEHGYVLQMRDGELQYSTADLRLSEIRFSSYDLSIEFLTQQRALNDNATSLVLVQRAIEGGWTPAIVRALVERSGEGLRVIGMCLLMAGIAAFPGGARRRGRIPLEFAVLVIAFTDRGLSTYAPSWLGVLQPATGGLAMISVGTLLILWRLWGYLIPLPRLRLRRVPA
jgi:lipopolysaccharide export system permease protein